MAQESDHDRISRKAHEIWESEGRPHGRDQQHWDQAKEIVALHDSMGDTLLPRDTGTSEPDESKEIADAAGDVPNLTDQGKDDLTDIAREPEVTKPRGRTAAKAAGGKGSKPGPAPASPNGTGAPTTSAPSKPAAPARTSPAPKSPGRSPGKR